MSPYFNSSSEVLAGGVGCPSERGTGINCLSERGTGINCPSEEGADVEYLFIFKYLKFKFDYRRDFNYYKVFSIPLFTANIYSNYKNFIHVRLRV